MKAHTGVTLTGVDESMPLPHLANLSQEFPFVEWGFLYSPKRQGQPGRYPSLQFLKRVFKELSPYVRVALHLCGDSVTDFVTDEPVVSDLVRWVAGREGRVQLNFNASTLGFPVEELTDCIDQLPRTPFITQYNQANTDVWKQLGGCENHCVLFDASGGRGMSPGGWPAPLQGVRCGYAGGLGPENVQAELARIRAAAGDQPFWIDMEGKLRDQNDRFDLGSVLDVLRAAEASFSMPLPTTTGNNQ